MLLLKEGGGRALYGPLHERLIPLLDGTRQTEQITAELQPDFSPAEVYFALISLQARGYLCEGISTLSSAEAAFWSELGVDPEQAVRLIRASKVALRLLGTGWDDAVKQVLKQALAEAGLQVVLDHSDADLVLVVSDHYLNPDLDDLNTLFHKEGRRWLLMRPRGRELWLGPSFDPEQPGCQACLSRLLRRQSQLEQFASSLRDVSDRRPPPPAMAPGGVALMARLASLEVGRILAAASPATAGQVISFDLATYNSRSHALVVDPCCDICGEQPNPHFQPVHLQSCEVRFQEDGGHRHVSPAETLARFDGLISPITGIVSELCPVNSPLTSAHVVLAGRNSAQQIETFDDLRRNLRSCAAGKGASELQARASALGEALERFSGENHPGIVRERASYHAMRDRYGDAVIHPNAVMRLSEHQFAQREHLNALGSRFNRVTEPLDPDLDVDWTPIWSLSQERRCYLPSQLLVLGRHDSDEPWIAMGCSNGNAAGNTLEEAVLQGLLEVVERDSIAIWWYNRLQRPGIDLSRSGDRWITDLIEEYRSNGREVWALDLTADLDMTCVVALSRNVDADAERILFGFGCHLDPRIAVQRALAEMNQMLGIAEADLDSADDGLGDGETLRWLKTATLDNQPYLRPDPDQPLRRLDQLSDHHSGDLLLDIQYCCSCLEAKGLEVLVLNQTRPMVGLPVVKVVVPGLRHFWARFAPGRLYDVPVQLGLLDRPLREEELNPVPMFI